MFHDRFAATVSELSCLDGVALIQVPDESGADLLTGAGG